MTTPAPLWLKISLLPFLAGAAYCLDFEIRHRTARFAIASNFDDFSTMLVMLGQVVGPLLAACLIAYPLARLFERRWALAALGVLLLTLLIVTKSSWLEGRGLLDEIPAGLSFFFFALFLLAIASGVHRAMHGSRLLIAARQGGDVFGPILNPRALKLILLPVLVIGLFLVDDLWREVTLHLRPLPPTRTGRLTSLMCASFLGPALLATAVAFPITRIYGRWALLVGALAPMLATAWWATTFLATYGSAFVGLTYAVKVATLAALTPLLAWWFARRWKDSGLMILPA